MGRSEPTPATPEIPPARPDPPAEVPGTRGAALQGSEREGDQDEAVLPSVATAERGRRRVIALALTLTAVVAFALTRGGEPDSRGQDQARANPETPADPGIPSRPSNPSQGPPPQCSGVATTPAAPDPAEAVPAATADYYFQSSLESSLETAPDLVEVERGSSVFTVDGRTGTTVLRLAEAEGWRWLRRRESSGARTTPSRSCSASISSWGTERSSISGKAPPTPACTCWTDA
jgi:hypothetical protein